MRLLKYLVVNAVFAACLYIGIMHGVVGAANLALCMAWVSIVTAHIAVCSKDVIAERAKTPPIVPLWVDQIFDMSVVALMIWHGWWITGVGYIFHMGAIALCHKKADEIRKAAAATDSSQP